MKKIILIGAGGQAKSCIDVIHLTKNYKIVGFIDIKKKKKILNYKVLGNEQYLKKLNKKSTYLHISLGFIKSPEISIILSLCIPYMIFLSIWTLIIISKSKKGGEPLSRYQFDQN